MELELDMLEKMAKIGQNKAIISKLKKQLSQLEEENKILENDINKECCDIGFIRDLNDRDLKLFMKYIYQEGFQDCVNVKIMNSDKAICEWVEEFKKW